MRPPILTTPRPPYDRRLARRLNGMPGPADFRGAPTNIPDGEIRERNGFRSNDSGISFERMPWYDRDYMVGQDNTLVDWTRCGPVRPSLHMLNHVQRIQAGTTATRNFDPHPVDRLGMQDQGHGFHTNPAPNRVRTMARYRGTVQQQPARFNRLSPAANAGQSYSQTTRVQGG